MNKVISRGLWGVLFVAGLSVLGATAANAAETGGDDGTASGTQGIVSLGAPIGVGGNAVSILGDSSSANAAPTSAPTTTEPSTSSTSGGNSVLGGTQGIVELDEQSPALGVADPRPVQGDPGHSALVQPFFGQERAHRESSLSAVAAARQPSKISDHAIACRR